MSALEELNAYTAGRLADLKREKERGRTIVGYTAGGYCPEELILACGAIPLGFVHAGNQETVVSSGPYVSRWFDPFWLSQLSYVITDQEPFYNLADLIVNAATDTHCRCFSMVTEYYVPEKAPFLFGVPHTKTEGAEEYYLSGLYRLKGKLEELTENSITDAKLQSAIVLCNRERKLLQETTDLRKTRNTPVVSKDFVALHHASHLAEKEFMVGILGSYLDEMRRADPPAKEGPRILLTGSGLALGDTHILDSVEAAGGTVVFEEFAECLRPYHGQVSLEGDLMANLARTYFTDRPAPGWFNPVDERIEYLVGLVNEYQVDGVVWYNGQFRESYKVQCNYVPDTMKERTGLNTIIFETYYEPTEIDPMDLRLKAFVDSLKEGSHV